MSSMSLKESIMESFSQFFHKIVNNHPLKEELLQNLTTFQQIIMSDNSNYLQTKLYISSLCQKSLTKTSQNHSQMSPADLPTDLSLKEFTPEKLRSPFSLLTKFTYATFKDYLTKNLISLPIDSPLLYRFSHIREFLPDSQNFYRVIGLSLLEVFLSDISHLSRLYEWYNKIFHRDLTLSSHIYSFPAEELRSTFCGYLKQLIQTRVDSEETREGQKSRNLLYNMDCKDAIFDMALISFVKEMLIRKLDNSKLSMENFQGRIKANDSALIEDLIGEISHTFNVNLIVQIVQNKTVSEVVYAVQTNDPRASPTLHILNEKQISYQNFSILNIDNFDNDIFSNQNQSVSHVRNTSLQHSQPSLNPKLEKAFSTDSKNPLEKPSKNIRPSQILSKRASLPEGGINYNRRSVSDKVEPDFLNQFVDKIEFKFDEEDIKPNKEELSPKEGVLSLSKILNGSADTKSKQSQEQEESPMNLTNQNQDAHYEKKDDLSKLNENSNQPETPPKFQNQFFKDNDSLKSPQNLHVSPLTLNLTPATQLQEQSMKSKTSIQPPDQTQLFNYDVNILETQKEKIEIQETPMNVLQPRDNNKPTLNNLPSKEINLNTKFNNNNEKTTVQEVQKPKIVTMIPKFMSSIPYNPFSMGPSQVSNPMNAFQTQDQNIRDTRQIGKINPKPDAEDNSGYLYRRFSLNPLAFPGDNIEQLNKRHSLTGSTGKQLRMSGQKSENNNFGNKYE